MRKNYGCGTVYNSITGRPNRVYKVTYETYGFEKDRSFQADDEEHAVEILIHLLKYRHQFEGFKLIKVTD